MSNIDKQSVQSVADLKAGYTLGHADVAILNELARIALASLEAEPVAFINGAREPVLYGAHIGIAIATQLYTAPPAPVSVPECFKRLLHHAYGMTMGHDWNKGTMAGHHRTKLCQAVEECRAAMLQGADSELQRKAAIHDALCQKYNVESLADFVDWQRNHIAELEAAPPAPVGEGETAVMPDYPGYTMTQRECFQAGKKAGLAEAGSSPVIPDGCALVPVEPTLEMIKAGANAASTGMLIPGMYRAMITAAPQQEVKNG
jgi:hypothetical protein